MSSADRITDADADPADRAFELYLERGVVIPEYAGEIAERRRVMRDWDDHGGLR